MPEGKYVEYGQMKITALEHAVNVGMHNDLDAEGIVSAAEHFYLFLIGD